MFHSAHEGHSVILEEVEEAKKECDLCEIILSQAWKDIKENDLEDAKDNIKRVKVNAINLATEAIQVAAMAQKFIDSMEVEE